MATARCPCKPRHRMSDLEALWMLSIELGSRPGARLDPGGRVVSPARATVEAGVSLDALSREYRSTSNGKISGVICYVAAGSVCGRRGVHPCYRRGPHAQRGLSFRVVEFGSTERRRTNDASLGAYHGCKVCRTCSFCHVLIKLAL